MTRVLFCLLCICSFELQASEFYELEPINYLENEGNDQVKTFFEQKSEPWKKWKEEPHFGYLKDLLRAFKVPFSSQVLVYSKTSFQISHINPHTPRAIYFNDEIYIGWVMGSRTLEISVASPENGTNFYTLSPQKGNPLLYRETHDCLQCHGGSRTRSIPGHLIRSVYTKPNGHAILKAGSDLVDLRLPWEKRFGGWYVTGLKNSQHRGNQIYTETDYGAEKTSQAPLFENQHRIDHHNLLHPDSDVIAHLVLQHQVQFHNALSKLTLMTQKALHDQKVFDKLLERDGTMVESTLRRIHHAAEDLIDSMFFYEEVTPLPEMVYNTNYRTDFENMGPKDKKDRSLRKLDLHQRLFRYPLSYLIYSDSFLKLPAYAKQYVLTQISDILNPEKVHEKFNYIDERDKKIILSILHQTHPDFKS